MDRRTFVQHAVWPVAGTAAGHLHARSKPPGLTANVRDHGARGDGRTIDTAAIQDAIDTCADAGGGHVYVPAGTFLTGTLFLRRFVALYLDHGATLLGSTYLSDYPTVRPSFRSYTDNYTERSLIYAEGAEHISILGPGTIDGQGATFSGTRQYKGRPYLLRIISCRHVLVRDVTMLNSAMWTQHFMACEHITIDNIHVRTRVNKNNDGIDIDGCRYVHISNCHIDSGDDAIALKASAHLPSRDICITNCIISSFCNAIKLGTESNGGFHNIVVSNCTIYNTRLAGIAIEMVDGGFLDGITVTNIVMDHVSGGIFVRLGNRARPFRAGMERPGMGSLRNIVLNNISGTGCGNVGCAISGLPGYPIENVIMERIRLTFEGGGTLSDAQSTPPELPEAYPEYNMFGRLPAYGFYCRHVQKLDMAHVDVSFDGVDMRPAVVCEDVQNLSVQALTGENSEHTPALLVFKDVQRAFVSGNSVHEPLHTFAGIQGSDTDHISIANNDLRLVERVVSSTDDVRTGTVIERNNIV